MKKSAILFFTLFLYLPALVTAQAVLGGTPETAAGSQVSSTSSNTSNSSCTIITRDLRYTAVSSRTGGEVTVLQNFLKAKGYLNTEPTGRFGLATLQAVRDFQLAKGLPTTGNVATLTAAKINEINCAGSAGATSGTTSGTVSGTPQNTVVTNLIQGFSVFPTSIVQGQLATLSWSSSADHCVISNKVDSGNWVRSRIITEGQGSVSVAPQGSAQYKLSCYDRRDEAGAITEREVSVGSDAPPTATIRSFTASPATTDPGQLSKFKWDAVADHCVISNKDSMGNWARITSMYGQAGEYVTAPMSTSKYRLSCFSDLNENTPRTDRELTVTVNGTPDLSASNSTTAISGSCPTGTTLHGTSCW